MNSRKFYESPLVQIKYLDQLDILTLSGDDFGSFDDTEWGNVLGRKSV